MILQSTKHQIQSTIFLVRKGGLEPPHLSVPDPKSGASANSATFARALAKMLGLRSKISRGNQVRHKGSSDDPVSDPRLTQEIVGGFFLHHSSAFKFKVGAQNL